MRDHRGGPGQEGKRRQRRAARHLARGVPVPPDPRGHHLGADREPSEVVRMHQRDVDDRQQRKAVATVVAPQAQRSGQRETGEQGEQRVGAHFGGEVHRERTGGRECDRERAGEPADARLLDQPDHGRAQQDGEQAGEEAHPGVGVATQGHPALEQDIKERWVGMVGNDAAQRFARGETRNAHGKELVVPERTARQLREPDDGKECRGQGGENGAKALERRVHGPKIPTAPDQGIILWG